MSKIFVGLKSNWVNRSKKTNVSDNFKEIIDFFLFLQYATKQFRNRRKK